MIHKIEMRGMWCDRCGKPFSNPITGKKAYECDILLLNDAVRHWVKIGDKHYCPSCCERSAETGELKVRDLPDACSNSYCFWSSDCQRYRRYKEGSFHKVEMLYGNDYSHSCYETDPLNDLPF